MLSEQLPLRQVAVHDEEPVHGCRVGFQGAVRPYMSNGSTVSLEGLRHQQGSMAFQRLLLRAQDRDAVVGRVVNEPLQSPLKHGSGRDTIVADPPVLVACRVIRASAQLAPEVDVFDAV